MNYEEAYSRLNPEQKAAVDQIEGPVMVLAGPGTGKTQMLALRIAHILQETQLSPHNILCLTFTESGVAAMRKRLTEFIGSPAYYVRIHTFHSFCNEIIQKHPEKFLFARELAPLADVEGIELFRDLLDALPAGHALKPFAAPYLYERDAASAIKDLKREDIPPETLGQVLAQLEAFMETQAALIEPFIEIHGNSLKAEDCMSIAAALKDSPRATLTQDLDLDDKKARTAFKNAVKEAWVTAQGALPKQKGLVELYKSYQAELGERGRYDYEDMVLFVVKKMKEDPELLAQLQEQFQYILVDEYQDTNGAQNEVVELLASYYDVPNVFVVGDDKQSIYRFQGASLENMVAFYHRYKDALHTVTVQENYRSQQAILDAATSLIHHNTNDLSHLMPELAQKLSSQVDHPLVSVRLAELETPPAERYFLAQEVRKLLEAGTDPSEIAILYRNNRDGEALANLFARLELPFHLYAGKNILEEPSIRGLMSLLRWLDTCTDDALLFRVLNLDFLALPSLEVLQVTRRAADSRKSLWDTLETGSEPFQKFREKAAQWHALRTNKTLPEWFETVIQESGYLAQTLAQPDRLTRLNQLNTFFDQIKQQSHSKKELTLAEFFHRLDLLQEHHLGIREQELSTQKKAVALLTAHHSKGLEFEHVFVMHCVDKHWGNQPSRSKLKLPEGLLKTLNPSHTEKNEDERRLFYVAMTRAKKTLTLSHAKTNENGKEEVPSLFLQEIDPASCQAVDTAWVEDEVVQRLEASFLPIHRESSQEEMAFVKSLLDGYVLSVTHLNNYLKCPRLFYYQNILRVPSAKTRHQAFGTAVHRALQELYTQATASKEAFLNSFEKSLSRETLTAQDFKETLAFGQETLGAYYEHLAGHFSNRVLCEYDFSPHHVHVDGVPITGKLDKVEILDPAAQTVHIVDYKTGNPDTKASDLAPNGDYWCQIVFYQLLCDHSTQFPYTMSSGAIDFVQKSAKQNGFTSRRYTVTEEDKAALRTTLKEVYQEILALSFLNLDEWKACGECEWCTRT